MTEFWMILICVSAFGVIASLILDKLVNPWLSKRRVGKMMTDIKAGKSIPTKPRDWDFEISFDNSGFFIAALKKKQSEPIIMKWDEVQKAVAFKRDLFTVDQLCVFFARNDETGIEVDEDMKGWSAFTEKLPDFLPTAKPLKDWIWKVTQTPFAPCTMEIFNRTTIYPD